VPILTVKQLGGTVLRVHSRGSKHCLHGVLETITDEVQMRKRIQDEFTDLPISRQRKYQLRMQRDKRCTECGQAAIQGSRCLKHLVKARERQRKKRGLKRRYMNTLSYRLEATA
jgi:hypothetical protein